MPGLKRCADLDAPLDSRDARRNILWGWRVKLGSQGGVTLYIGGLMSIEAAAKELTKEIERLHREAERLTKLRDALSSGSTAPVVTVARRAYKKQGAKKNSARVSPLAKKSAAKTVPPAKKKRVMSPEGRKAIADATRRRWALKRKADASAEK